MPASLLDGLNPAQRQACETIDGPTLILAGAGSGKTRTLTHRVAHLLQQQAARPQQVLTVTFTNKAAGELRERLQDLLPDGSGRKVWAMTFHALCVRILRQSGETVGLNAKFSIADTDDCRKIIRECLRDVAGEDGFDKHDVRRVRSAISYAKNHVQTADDVERQPDGKLTAKVWRRYEQRLRDMTAVDFDDLIALATEVLRTEQGAAAWAGRFRYVLVDEYQDTNQAQYQLLRLLLGDHRNLCVVGDDMQSIYGFRGAKVEHILRFTEDWPDATVVKLEDNYRSTPQIIACANAVIADAEEGLEKKLVANRPAGDPVRLVLSPTGWDEADFVVGQIRTLLDRGASADQVAVVYRNNAESQNVEERLTAAGIPYRVIGGTEFMARAEIKTARAYLQLLDNPTDMLAFERVVANPRRGIGDAALAAVAQAASGTGRTLLDVSGDERLLGSVTGRGRAALGQLAGLYAKAVAAQETTPLSQLLHGLLRASGLLQSYIDAKDGADQVQNLGQLVSLAKRFDAIPAAQALTLFLEQTALATDADKDGDGRSVSLMTVHATKGLEFPYVFLVGCEEELFFPRTPDSKDVEEARRLLYVGITRAQHCLWMSVAARRMRWGQMNDQRPLRFLSDLPADVKQVHVKGRQTSQPAGRSGARRSAASEPQRSRPASQRTGTPRQATPRQKPSPAAAKVTFSAGQQVQHPKFGRGVVTSDAEDRVKVRFADGTRTLDKQWANLTPG